MTSDQEAEIMREAIANPHRFVLKPNREGGGGNYYGEEVADKLESLGPQERSAHILMQRLTPMIVKVKEREWGNEMYLYTVIYSRTT